MSSRALHVFAVLTMVSCGRSSGVVSPPSPARATSLILAREQLLAETRQRIQSGDTLLKAAYDSLIKSAEGALTAAPPTVMQKRRIPSSGNRHDFMSLAPYWWPDTTKPNGLPYIRRDGVVNPESRIDHDGTRFQAMFDAVEALSLAHYFTGETKYSRRAVTLLRVWFVDSATRMNPNLRYAQGVPGVTDGRGTGIIDTRNIPRLLDAVRVLAATPALSVKDYSAVTAWFRSYLAWLRDSKNGREEWAADNNHGTWYDAQVVALALFVGDTSLARNVLTSDTRRRIGLQIRADGSQPLELARTRPIHYSLFNLDAYTQLAEMGRRIGVDLWRYEAQSGASLQKALLFLAPYADSSVKWTNPDVTPVLAVVFAAPFRRAELALGTPQFTGVLDTLARRSPDPSRTSLFYPRGSGSGVDVDTLLQRALDRAAEKLRASATQLDPADGYPRYTRPDGSWEQRPANQWTSGFFGGTLWFMYQVTRKPEWKDLAERWTKGLESDKSITSTHDLGFMIFNSFGHGYLLTGNPHYKEVVLDASRSLATRYSPRVGAIKSWDTERSTDRRRSWKYPVIIDNLMNLDLLFWSAANGGETEWKNMAEQHAITAVRTQVRADGSTVHVALFDPMTGNLEKTVTWQGYSDSSTWARGQAWAIHGFTNAYARTGRPELLAAAQKTADYFISHLPADAIPYWDFRHPDIPNTERDASAAAIAASGLLELARRTDASSAARYREVAEKILVSLARDYTAGPESAAILKHAVGGRPQNVEVDVGLVYADYYYIEALLRRRELFLE